MIQSDNSILTTDSQLQTLQVVCDQHFTCTLLIDVQQNNFPIIHANSSFLHEKQTTKNKLLGQPFEALYNQYTDTSITEQIVHALKSRQPIVSQVYIQCDNEQGFWCELTGHPIQTSEGNVTYYLFHANNITPYIHMKFSAELEREVYKYIEEESSIEAILTMICKKIDQFFFNTLQCSIFFTNTDRTKQPTVIGNISDHFSTNFKITDITEKLDCESSRNTSKNFNCVNQSLCRQHNVQGCWSYPIYNQHQALLGQLYLFFKTTKRLHSSELNFIQNLTPLIAMAHKYEESRYKLKKLAYFDVSLDIPNFNYFTQLLKQWTEEGRSGVLTILQPGEYTHIVDYYSRSTGDELLHQIVERIQSFGYKKTDIFGRLSNSAIIIAQESSEEDIGEYQSYVRQLTMIPYFLKDREIYITLKLGVSLFGPQIEVEDSIRYADIALSKARKETGTAYHFFEDSREEELRLAIDVLSQLTKAITEEQIVPYLQPKIDLKTGEISGFEALARWVSPVLGFVAPSVFIPVAEDTGKIREIDQMILIKVLQWLRHRLDNHIVVHPVSVNISPKHFYYASFIEEFTDIVSHYNIDPSLIIVEVTESVELVDVLKAKKILKSLQSFGFKTSIDDFGVGFSSLSYLQQLPFNEIKIDRSFINTIEEADMSAVVQTIIQLANNLTMSSVAEGIETAAQYDSLKTMGCVTGQGYYFYKPMPLKEIDQLLEQH